MTDQILVPTCTPAMTHAEIVAACLAAVADRDPRIVAALDAIEGVAHVIDQIPLAADKARHALETLDAVYRILSAPTSIVSQQALVQASPA